MSCSKPASCLFLLCLQSHKPIFRKPVSLSSSMLASRSFASPCHDRPLRVHSYHAYLLPTVRVHSYHAPIFRRPSSFSYSQSILRRPVSSSFRKPMSPSFGILTGQCFASPCHHLLAYSQVHRSQARVSFASSSSSSRRHVRVHG